MHQTDQKIIIRLPLKSGNILERIINAAGEPYSCIIENGVEMASAPTNDEGNMLRAFHDEILVR